MPSEPAASITVGIAGLLPLSIFDIEDCRTSPARVSSSCVQSRASLRKRTRRPSCTGSKVPVRGGLLLRAGAWDGPATKTLSASSLP